MFILEQAQDSQPNVLSQRQILGTGNLPQDSAPVCIDIDISEHRAPTKPSILCHRS